MIKSNHYLTIALCCMSFVLFWQVMILIFDLPSYLIASPKSVVVVLFDRWDMFFAHFLVTLQEIIIGLFLGILLGFLAALCLAFSSKLNRFFLPILISSQAIPVFAIAPLLVLWLGYGMASKIFMTVLIIFFPITSNCLNGLKNTPENWLALSQSLKASRLQTLIYVRLPSALPALSSGIRIAVCYAPIGAIIGEWVGSAEGLGYLMLHANARVQTDILFAALILLITCSLTLYFIVNRILDYLVPWQKHMD